MSRLAGDVAKHFLMKLKTKLEFFLCLDAIHACKLLKTWSAVFCDVIACRLVQAQRVIYTRLHGVTSHISLRRQRCTYLSVRHDERTRRSKKYIQVWKRGGGGDNVQVRLGFAASKLLILVLYYFKTAPCRAPFPGKPTHSIQISSSNPHPSYRKTY